MTAATLTREPPVKPAVESGDSNIKQFPPKTRVQLDLTPRAMLLLTELKEKTEASTYAEVIKAAMKLYDGLISETEKGHEFLVRDKDGRVAEFRIFL
jgi:hypothetical protein